MSVEKKVTCDRCGERVDPLVPNLTGTFDLCRRCLDDLKRWIQKGVQRSG